MLVYANGPCVRLSVLSKTFERILLSFVYRRIGSNQIVNQNVGSATYIYPQEFKECQVRHKYFILSNPKIHIPHIKNLNIFYIPIFCTFRSSSSPLRVGVTFTLNLYALLNPSGKSFDINYSRILKAHPCPALLAGHFTFHIQSGREEQTQER